MNKFEYKNLTPFKWFVLENFPFIEADFDALTEWQLFCKLGKEMNKVIDKMNLCGEQTENLTNAFNNLKNYVDNYFENLDVQDEINNKLNEMVEDGTLDNIINEKIFSNLNEQITSNTNDINLLKEQTTSNTNDINLLNEQTTILIGDSYSLDRRPNIEITGWAVPLKELMGLNDNECYILQDNGGGFIANGSLGTFLNAITNANIQNKNNVKNILVCGGLNDANTSKNQIKLAIKTFITYCKNNFPNAQVFIGHIGNENDETNYNGQLLRYNCFYNSLPAYRECSDYGGIYLNGVEYIMKDYSNYYDRSHPNQVLCNKLASGIYQAFKNGFVSVNYKEKDISFSSNTTNINKLPFKEIFINNNWAIINFPEFETYIEFNSAQKFVGSQIILGEIETNYYRSVYPFMSIANCLITLYLSDGSKQELPATLEVYDFQNKHYLVLNYTRPSSTSYNVTKIGFKQFNNSLLGELC